jgi:hypothetical protein
MIKPIYVNLTNTWFELWDQDNSKKIKKNKKKSQDSRFNNLISNNESKEKLISPK